MARTRTTKKLAQRIDLNYFKRPTPLKRAKFWFSLLLPLLALIWIAERTILKDSRVYSSGRLSRPHAVLEKECAACHLQKAGVFSAKAADSACLDCHDGPVHHPAQVTAPDCATCHTEHRGRISIAAASNQACVECHSNLAAVDGKSHYANRIHSFEDGHPQFAATVGGARDPGTIKLNHAIHMKPIRRGPNGPNVQLECGNCHRPASVGADLTYSDAKDRATAVSYRESDEVLPLPAGILHPPKPVSGRELMAPVKFANACAACHLLTFDKRFDDGVPHDKPEVIYPFLVKKFSDYIAAHPAELREMQDPARDLTRKPFSPRLRTLTPSQWVSEHVAVAQELLSHKTCSQCHQILLTPLQDANVGRWSPSDVAGNSHLMSEPAPLISQSPMPLILPAKTTLRWMPHAKFDHGAHTGFTCVSCHAKAMTSTESSDILLPGIETCRKCHAPGPEHAESRCFECHTYHDWSKRKEVSPKFTLPALRIGGR